MAKSSEAAVKDYLLKENEEFRRLAKKHRQLDERLTALSEKFLLSDEEKFEEVTLKKQKLAIKDKMADLIRRHQGETDTGRGHVRPAPVG